MRTSVKNNLTPGQKRLEAAAWILVGLTFLLAVCGGCTIKDAFPTHYGAGGQADGFGSAWILLVYPVLGAMALGILSLVAHCAAPETWNLPFVLREANKTRVFRDMLTMLFLLEVEIAAVFLAAVALSLMQKGELLLPLTGVFLAGMAWTLIHGCRKAAGDNRAEA